MADTAHRKVLVVEDEPEIAQLVQIHLEDMGCQVTLAADGDSGLAHTVEQRFDLIVLDLMLPGADGLEICRRVRARPSYTPILILTARSSELDRVLGLEMGADDYLTKPFSLRELMARVKAIFRRVEALAAAAENNQGAVLRAPGLTIDQERRTVSREGEPVHLTAKEFDLLSHFARHPGRVYTRSELLDQVWGYGHAGYEHTVNSHINRLRGKIEEDPAEPRYILTVWGVGYKFSEQPETAEPSAGAPG